MAGLFHQHSKPLFMLKYCAVIKITGCTLFIFFDNRTPTGDNMKQSVPVSTSHAVNHIDTAEAFYRVFCALPKKDRMAVAGYIFQDTEVRHNFGLPEIPNDQTLKSFAEEKSHMPVFSTVKSLREDLLS